jgi:hypothetical protein
LLKGYSVPLPGAERDPFAGEIGAAKDKGSLSLGYTMGDFGFNTQFTYIGKSAVDDQILAANLCADDPNVCAVPAPPKSANFPSKVYTDVQFTVAQGKMNFYFGIDNLFNTKAPRLDTNDVFGISGGGATGVGTVGDVYDPIGRRYSAGVRLKF